MESSEAFPAVDAEEALNPVVDDALQVDPFSSDIAKTIEKNEETVEEKNVKEEEKKDVMQGFKFAMVLSGLVVALAGSVFAITKKLKQKR